MSPAAKKKAAKPQRVTVGPGPAAIKHGGLKLSAGWESFQRTDLGLEFVKRDLPWAANEAIRMAAELAGEDIVAREPKEDDDA